jgi:hypothetical protein
MCDSIESNLFSSFPLMEFSLSRYLSFPCLLYLLALRSPHARSQEGKLCVSLLSTQPCSYCPLCGSAATRIHSRDPRKLADLPSAGQPVRFLLLCAVRRNFRKVNKSAIIFEKVRDQMTRSYTEECSSPIEKASCIHCLPRVR